MNCPHCQAELPVNYGGVYCPACGKDLPSQPDPPVGPDLRVKRFNFLLFFAVLVAPVLLTVLTVRSASGGDNSIAVFIVILGGPVSGIICGTMLASRLGQTTSARVILGIVLIPAMVVVCVIMNFYGCVAGLGLH